jgi:hypothetical protein
MQDVPSRLAALMKLADPPFPSLAAAAEAYGIGYETFKKIASKNAEQTRGLSLANAKKIARFHRIPTAWVLTGEGKSGLSGIRMIGKIGAGQEMMEYNDPGNEEPIDPEIAGPDALALFVDGDSMRPLARDGDLIFVGPAQRDITTLIGEECAVFLEDGRRFFKIIEHGSQQGRFDLISHNAAPIRNVEIHSAGRFLALKRRYNHGRRHR